MRMLSYITQAVVWGMRRALHRDRPRLAHVEVEHAHWDPEGRRWYTHAA